MSKILKKLAARFMGWVRRWTRKIECSVGEDEEAMKANRMFSSFWKR